MTIIISALIILLVLLSWKYILRLEPAGILAAMWAFLITAVLLMQDYIVLRYYGILYIAVCINLFVLGTIFTDRYYHPKNPSPQTLTFKKELALPLLTILLVSAMVTPLYTIVLHGFSLRTLIDMREVLEMNKGISEDRYSGIETHNLITQIFLIFCYVAPLIGGFCFRWCNKYGKIMSILTLIPGTFIAFTQAMKMGMVSGFILWITGFLVCSFSYRLPIKIKFRNILILCSGLIVLFAFLFFSMVFRTGEISEKAILTISQSFVSYALGQFHCFDMWYTSYEPTSYAWGAKTFMGISNVLGLEERTQGVYSEFYQIGQNGFYGIANIFTIFRSLIEDFGEVGAAIFMFIIGCLSKITLKNLLAGKQIVLNQVFLTAFYAYLLWSFATSFFTYTSYIAMFVVSFFIFHLIQKETLS